MSTTPVESLPPVNFLYPLVKRTRTEAVTAELTELSRLERASVLKYVASADTREGPAWETLVAMARAYLRAGDPKAARQVLDALVRRVGALIAGKVAGWEGVTSEDRVDAKREAIRLLLRCVLNLDAGQELWECNFRHCFNFRMISLWKKIVAGRGREVSLSAQNTEGETYDGLEQIADPQDAFAELEGNDFCRLLLPDYPQISRLIHLRLAGYSDVEIAAQVGVTDRTLRNWTKIAQSLWAKYVSGHALN